MANQHQEDLGRLVEQFKEDSRKLNCVTRKLEDAGDSLERLGIDLKKGDLENASRYLEDIRLKGEAPSIDDVKRWLCQHESLSRKVRNGQEDLKRKHGIKCLDFDD